MSIGKVEQDLQRIKEEFSEISPGRATKAEPVQEKKGSSSIIIWGSVAAIVLALVVLVIVLQ